MWLRRGKTLSPAGSPWLFLRIPVFGKRLRACWVLSASCSPGQLCSAGNFVFGLTLKSPHSLSCTVIHISVLDSHRDQLHGEVVLGHIHCLSDSTLERWVVLRVHIYTYIPYPLEPLPWWQADPALTTAADRVTRDSTCEGQGLQGLQMAMS
jgi:hypothetical protein